MTGCIGPVSSLEKKSACVSESVVGIGNTCAWRLGGVDHNTAAAFYFDVSNAVRECVLRGSRAELVMVVAAVVFAGMHACLWDERGRRGMRDGI